jgi:hypothetical protein
MPTIQEIINLVDDIKINTYSEAAKTAWINKVEGWVKDQIIKTYSYFEISRVKDQAAYAIPSGVSFANIAMAYMDKYPIQKLDVRSLDRTGYFLGADGKINIYPVPSQDDTTPGLRFVHKIPHIKYVYAEDKDAELLVPSPYDNIYETYIYAMIDWHNREFKAYNNTFSMYNEAWKDFANWYKQNNPIPPTQIKNLW